VPGGQPNPEPQPSSMLCIDCGYSLVQLDEQRCPECGRAFDPQRRSTFRRPGDERKFSYRWRFDLQLLAVGISLYAPMIVVMGVRAADPWLFAAPAFPLVVCADKWVASSATVSIASTLVVILALHTVAAVARLSRAWMTTMCICCCLYSVAIGVLVLSLGRL